MADQTGPEQALSAYEILEATVSRQLSKLVGTGDDPMRAFLDQVRKDVRTALQRQSEMRGVPVRIREIHELSEALSVDMEASLGQLRMEIPVGWLESVDGMLSNRRCSVCGSLVAAGEHREECGSALAGSVMDT